MARGPFQITPICLEDVNRIQSHTYFTIEDCFNLEKSLEIFHIYTSYYTPDYDFEQICRRWYGGPTGHQKKSTLKYWKSIEGEFKRLRKKSKSRIITKVHKPPFYSKVEE